MYTRITIFIVKNTLKAIKNNSIIQVKISA